MKQELLKKSEGKNVPGTTLLDYQVLCSDNDIIIVVSLIIVYSCNNCITNTV